MKKMSNSTALDKIKDYFKQKNLDSKDTKKIRRFAMKYKIRLGGYRKRFCKKCLSDLNNGKIRITKNHKIIECGGCGEKNKFKIS